MYKKLFLLLLSFAMFACSGASVSMQGKGFEEFPKVEATQSGVVYSIELILCSDNYYMSCPSDAPNAIMVNVQRIRFWDQDESEYAKALTSAGFENVNGFYRKWIGSKTYETVLDSYEQSDKYYYVIEKPTKEMLEQFTVSTEKILFTKAAIAMFAEYLSYPSMKEVRDYLVDMETALTDLEKVGFFQDSLILEDVKTMVLMGYLKIDKNTIELLIVDEEAESRY